MSVFFFQLSIFMAGNERKRYRWKDTDVPNLNQKVMSVQKIYIFFLKLGSSTIYNMIRYIHLYTSVWSYQNPNCRSTLIYMSLRLFILKCLARIQFLDRMHFKKISTFLAWAVLTFLSHFSAKQFLSSSEHLTDNLILLTSLQMAAGSVLFLKMMISGVEEVNIPQ